MYFRKRTLILAFVKNLFDRILSAEFPLFCDGISPFRENS
jgi:hypothetical protein